MEDETRRSRRSTKFSGDYQTADFSDFEDSDDDQGGRSRRNPSSSRKSAGGKRLKECPGCSAMLPLPTKECMYCDYTFTSKSMVANAQTASAESYFIQNKFPFEPDREEDGSLKIASILGRRPRKVNGRWVRKSNAHADFSAVDAKFDYEYLVRFKSMSFIHVQWLSAHEIDTMNSRCKIMLMRYLTKLDAGDPTAPEDPDIDPSYTEVEKVLDMREEDVMEVVDEPTPEVVEASGESYEDKLTAPPKAVPSAATAEADENAGNGTRSSSRVAVVATNEPASLSAIGGDVELTRTQVWKPIDRCRAVIERIWSDPYSISFQQPVDTKEYDDYLDVVSEPMCLQWVLDKLDRGEYKTWTLSKFAGDVRLIWKNCKIYNLHKSQIWHCAHTLSLLFERLYQSWVLRFSDGFTPMTDPIARPWEPTCPYCLKDDNEEKTMLCDHCDAPFHIYCLRPKLHSIPEDAWTCPHCTEWISRTGAKQLSAGSEEEARQATEQTSAVQKVVRVRKKKYLVKWRGLSYQDCTWETVKDVDDDEKIAEYHRMNDAPPEEPPLTQAEIGYELAKERKSQLFPAMHNPHVMREIEAAVYSQIRAYHFLKWNKVPPDALLRECGPETFAYTLGRKFAIPVPHYLKVIVDKVLELDAKIRAGETVSDAISPEEEDIDGSSPEKAASGREQKKIEESVDEDEDLEEEIDGVDSSVPREKKKRVYASRAKKSDAQQEIEDTLLAITEAGTHGANIQKQKRTPEELLNRATEWYTPSGDDPVNSEVSLALAELVHHVARGTQFGPRPARPPLMEHEVEVCVPKGKSSLYMNIGEVQERVVVIGFRAQPDGTPGPAEATKRIKPGDVLVAINGVYVYKQGFQFMVKQLSSSEFPYVYLRFIRLSTAEQAKADEVFADCVNGPLGRRPIPRRSRYFGVHPSLETIGKWSAESYNDYTYVSLGEFDDEIDAARAYDAHAAKTHGRDWCRLNFKPEPLSDDSSPADVVFTSELTSGAAVLGRIVDEEIEHEQKAAESIRKMKAAVVLSKNKSIASEGEGMDVVEEGENEDDSDEESVDFKMWESDDTDDSDSGSDAEKDANSASDDDEDEAKNSSDSDDDGDAWEEENNKDKEWRPKEEIEAAGPIGRLLRAVNESDTRPFREDWENYILELGMIAPELRDDGRPKRIEQIDIATNTTLKVWDTITAASRVLNIPVYTIGACTRGRVDTAGGFKWRVIYATDQEILAGAAADEDELEAIEEEKAKKKTDDWKLKLYEKSKAYKNGFSLRYYQIEGLNWLLGCWYTKRSSILADEMGLGKTAQVCSFLDHLAEVENVKGPFLIVVPLSTIEHWKREAEGWTHLSACLYHDITGGKDTRDVIREYEWYYKGRSRRLLKFNILITTYDDLIKDYEELAEIPWRVVVVDEAHRLRNINSKLIECMRSVVAKGVTAYGYQHRILMTGTPLQNNTQELWTLLNFIEPAKFPDAEKFAERFGSISSAEQVEALQFRIAPHILRRVKEDVAKDIPPKEETVIDVELTSMQKQFYRAIFERNHSFLVQSTKGSLPKLMNIQMELRKCCNHPFLIAGIEMKEMEDLEDGYIANKQTLGNAEFEEERMKKYMIPCSGKMVLLDKLLPKLKREGHKVLIFSQMVKMIDLIEEFCEFRHYSVERLDGRVRGNERQKAIDRFNKSPEAFVFLLSTRAGGVGINLTAADTVIIFDSDWNPQNDVQAMARCHRIGQEKPVTIYRLITRRSFEAEMFERASRKLGLEQAILGSRQFGDVAEEDAAKKMDAKEMELLLKQGAYAIFTDDAESENRIKEFCEQDIDSILDQRARVRIVEGAVDADGNPTAPKNRITKSLFTGGSSLEHAEIDVNDPNFWKKVLPDLVTPDIMLDRFKDVIPKKKDSDDEDDDNDDETGVSEKVNKFMTDMVQMMDGILDLKRRGQLPDRERNVSMKLLLRMTLRPEVFENRHNSQTQAWLTELEGTRRRGARPSLQELEDDTKDTGKKSNGTDKGRRRRRTKEELERDRAAQVAAKAAAAESGGRRKGRKPGASSAAAVEVAATEPRKGRKAKATSASAATTGRKRGRRGRRSQSSDEDDANGVSDEEENGFGVDDRYHALYADDSDDPEESRPKKKRGRPSAAAPSQKASSKRSGSRSRKSTSADSDDDNGGEPPIQYMNGGNSRSMYEEDSDDDMQVDDDDVDPYAAGGGQTML